jgi:hypothetical protein
MTFKTYDRNVETKRVTLFSLTDSTERVTLGSRRTLHYEADITMPKLASHEVSPPAGRCHERVNRTIVNDSLSDATLTLTLTVQNKLTAMKDNLGHLKKKTNKQTKAKRQLQCIGDVPM